MSTEIGVIRNSGSRGVDLSIVRFWGGEGNGPCLQLTARQEDGPYGYVQVSASDVIALMPEFKRLIDDHLKNKKREAESAIAEYRELEKTIVNDMRVVAEMAISQSILEFANLMFCGSKKIEPLESGDDRIPT